MNKLEQRKKPEGNLKQKQDLRQGVEVGHPFGYGGFVSCDPYFHRGDCDYMSGREVLTAT